MLGKVFILNSCYNSNLICFDVSVLGEGFMEAGGGLFDEQPEIPAAEVSMPAGNDGASSVSSEPVSVKKQQQKQTQQQKGKAS